jgi:hypothetical protein
MNSTHLTASSVNELLAGFTTVESMSFASLAPDNQCDLTFTLRRDKVDEGSLLSLRFHGVALLQLSDFGGGLTQVMCLRVEDVRDRQWENLSYSVSDLEDDRVRLFCRSIECMESAL